MRGKSVGPCIHQRDGRRGDRCCHQCLRFTPLFGALVELDACLLGYRRSDWAAGNDWHDRERSVVASRLRCAGSNAVADLHSVVNDPRAVADLALHFRFGHRFGLCSEGTSQSAHVRDLRALLALHGVESTAGYLLFSYLTLERDYSIATADRHECLLGSADAGTHTLWPSVAPSR